MRVLFLPHNLRTQFFIELIQRLRKDEGWWVSIVNDEQSRKFHSQFIASEDDYLAPPDFSRPTPVDSDTEQQKKTKALIRECERITGIPASRVLLTGERDIGQSFSHGHYFHPQSALASAACRNSHAPQIILQRIFHFADSALDHLKPDLIIAGHNAHYNHLAICMCAAVRRIPVAFNRMSKIASGRAFWTARADMFNERSRSEFEKLRSEEREPSKQAIARLKEYTEAAQTVQHIAQRWQIASTSTIVSAHIRFALLAASRLNRFLHGRKGIPAPVWPHVYKYYRIGLMKVLQQKFFISIQAEKLGSRKYVYLALHKEPELAINLQAPGWRNQKNLIAMLSAALPFGYELLVREHRFNLGRRGSDYYRLISNYPNVVLVDALDDQFKYVQNANLIVTDNGSTGWEGLLFGKPVLCLAESFYSHGHLGRKVSDPSDLGQAMIEMLSEKHPDTRKRNRIIGLMLDAEYSTTVPVEAENYSQCIDLLKNLLADTKPLKNRSLLRDEGNEPSHV